uniref:Protein Skeletor n=1 Tax=Toxocara canis TaxID=6265 RepID=A0A183U3R8_TOXCA
LDVNDKKSPRSETSDDSEMEEEEILGSWMTDSPTPEEEKPRDLTAKKELSRRGTTAFSTFDPLHFDPLRFLMNPSLKPALSLALNPVSNQAAMVNFQQQIARQLPIPPVTPSSAPKRSKLMIDEILNLNSAPPVVTESLAVVSRSVSESSTGSTGSPRSANSQATEAGKIKQEKTVERVAHKKFRIPVDPS